MPTSGAADPVCPAHAVLVPKPDFGRTAWFWVRRYAAQDLVAKLAVLLWAPCVAAHASTGVAASSCALVEVGVFYAVVWLRALRGRRRRLADLVAVGAAIVREYGPAELVDFAVRPGAIAVLLGAGIDTVAAVFVGSLLADAAFYATAMLGCRAPPAGRRLTTNRSPVRARCCPSAG